MRKISKRILSFILTLVMILTAGLSGVATESAKATDSENVLSFTYRFGDSTKILVNTNLPTNITRKDFLANNNECDITQKGDKTFGYVWMPQDTEEIVLGFTFSDEFEKGQTYGLSKGDIFGFEDANGNLVKYILDADYTFTYEGEYTWSVVKEENPVRDTVTIDGKTYTVKNRNGLTAGYTTETLVQFENVCDFKVPANNTKLNFKGTVMLDGELVENPDFQGYVGNTTIVLNANHGGKLLTIYEGSTIYYGELAFVVSETFNAKWENKAWTAVAEVPERRYPSFDMTFRYGTKNLIQVNTTLPVDTMLTSFNGSEEGFALNQGVNEYQQMAYAGMDFVNSTNEKTVTIAFHFNKNFSNGQNYKMPKGAKFTFGDKTYELGATYTFWFDGNGWFVVTEKGNETKVTVDGQTMDVIGKVSLRDDRHVAYATTGLLQLKDIADFGVLENDTKLSFRGRIFANGVEAKAFEVRGYAAEDAKKKISFVGLPDYKNTVLTITSGSIISYNGKAVIIEKAFHGKWDGVSTWTDGKWLATPTPIVSGDANANGLVDSVDLVYLKKQEGQTANDFTDLIVDQKVNTYDLNSMRSILVGVTTWDQIKEALLAEDNFNGGGEFVTFADRPANPTDPDKIEEYKAAGFNTATVTGEYTRRDTDKPHADYLLMTTGKTADVDTTDKTVLELKLKGTESTAKRTYIQLTTNITSLQSTGYDFIIGQKHNVQLDKTTGANNVGWCGISESSGEVYWTLNFNEGDVFKYQDAYTLKAGTTLTIDGTTYILDKDYKFEYTNDYRVSIENLDNAGLNVWIRNASNKNDYFTQDIMDLLELYKDVIDGVYAGDEPFTTAEVKTASNKYIGTEDLMTFADINEMLPTLNKYFADKYFFINQVGVYGYNHYEVAPKGTPTLSAYATFFDSYEKDVLKNVTSTKTPLCFDLYPLGYDTRKSKNKNFGSGLNFDFKDTWSVDKWQDTGISPYYLISMLTVANKAKEQGNIFSYYVQAKNNISETDTHPARNLASAKEISMQLYAGMACGATMYGYYLYNALPTGSEGGMIAANGNKTDLYGYVQSANKEALPFADVLKNFTWEGVEFVSGGSNANNSKNAEALKLVNDSGLSLLLNNETDGILGGASATDDILVGYYTKDGQAGYMVANYNDPKQVTSDNTVTLNFGDCNYARVYTGSETGLTSEIVELTGGICTVTLKAGGGCFIIPVKAAS